MTSHIVFSKQCTEFLFSNKVLKAAISKKTFLEHPNNRFGPSCFVNSLVSGYIDFTLYKKYFDLEFTVLDCINVKMISEQR